MLKIKEIELKNEWEDNQWTPHIKATVETKGLDADVLVSLHISREIFALIFKDIRRTMSEIVDDQDNG